LTSQWTIVAANGVTVVFAAIILAMKLGEGARARKAKQAR
jgi:hypothetical protein